MKKIWFVKMLAIAALLATPVASVRSVHAEPSSFNDPNMQVVWERTDKPVEMFTTARSYMWGPNTLPGSPSTEPYANSPGGQRTVQYFDKSRMEVNNPSGDRTNLFFITNGLLVREMVSGEMQFGDNEFQLHPQSLEAVAGDPATAGNGDCPNYATFRAIASLNNDNPSPNRVGQQVAESIDKAGAISTIISPDPSVVYATFDTNLKHNIPNKFNDFLNQTGPVFVNGQIVQDTVINSVFLAGFPLTDAFWVKAKVAGVEKDVLVQLYERRVLTYTPTNPSGFQVEMGNVGQHYFRWRYGGGPVGEQRVVFDSIRNGPDAQIFSMKSDGTDLKQLTTAGHNIHSKWSRDNQKIVYASATAPNATDIFVMNADGTGQTNLTNTPTVFEIFPDWSADGTKIYFTRSDELWVMSADGSNQMQLTFNTPGGNSRSTPSPDGNKVAFSSGRDGHEEVYVMNPDGSSQTRLTFMPNSHQVVTDWVGDKIFFQTETITGPPADQIWMMNSDGTNQTKISGDSDSSPTASPDLKQLALIRFAGGGTFNVFTMNADTTNQKNVSNVAPATDDRPNWTR